MDRGIHLRITHTLQVIRYFYFRLKKRKGFFSSWPKQVKVVLLQRHLTIIFKKISTAISTLSGRIRPSQILLDLGVDN